MQTDIGFVIEGQLHTVDGKDLLRLLQRCTAALQNRVPTGQDLGKGTSQEPFRLTSAQAWLYCARAKFKGGNKYVAVAGRMIEKQDKGFYVSDQGPVWQHKEGYSPAKSVKALGGGDPTYPTLAKLAQDPINLFPATAAARSEGRLDSRSLAPAWNDVAGTDKAVAAMRAMLKGTELSRSDLGRHYARMQTILPVLTVAMFLSEPARNGRAFAINLMLLDLAAHGEAFTEHGFNRFTLDQMLWHPDGLDDCATGDLLARPLRAPRSKNDRTFDQIRTKGQLHLVGGIMPASPTGGALSTEAVAERPASGQTLAPRDYRFDFIHMKELSVLTRWLQRQVPGCRSLSRFRLRRNEQALDYNSIVFPEDGKTSPVRQKMREIKTAIERRLASLDAL
ncbi:hypothetical protein C1O66_11205 [Paucibacter aquatile]|uniref:Uncharacterized protein n=1 Tax=Kinneretia aquatilis TaxID=2070761 RepID=A0A2N8KX41_9BURK|nr:hypothetical protein [Paucibacter aquatile]PND38034.1 hypothetical protein C1O66_11205 [Paucibacter aquatile]